MHRLSTVCRLLPLLVVVLAAVVHAAPTQAATSTGCGRGWCVNLIAMMADGKKIRTPVPPADEAKEPDKDEQVHLVAITQAPLAAHTWRLQIVDRNGNLYANCGTFRICPVYVWTDEDGRLCFVQDPVRHRNPWPFATPFVPYGPDGHTVPFAARIVDAWGRVVAQASYGVVFKEGDEEGPDEHQRERFEEKTHHLPSGACSQQRRQQETHNIEGERMTPDLR